MTNISAGTMYIHCTQHSTSRAVTAMTVLARCEQQELCHRTEHFIGLYSSQKAALHTQYWYRVCVKSTNNCLSHSNIGLSNYSKLFTQKGMNDFLNFSLLVTVFKFLGMTQVTHDLWMTFFQQKVS